MNSQFVRVGRPTDEFDCQKIFVMICAKNHVNEHTSDTTNLATLEQLR